MTMPHLMNCPHHTDAWCLDCVNDLSKTNDALEAQHERDQALIYISRKIRAYAAFVLRGAVEEEPMPDEDLQLLADRVSAKVETLKSLTDILCDEYEKLADTAAAERSLAERYLLVISSKELITEALEKKVATLEAALGKYADPKNWGDFPPLEQIKDDVWQCGTDGYDLARRALGMELAEPEGTA